MHVRAQFYMHAYMCIYACILKQTHMDTYEHTNVCSYARIHTYTPRVHTCTCLYINTHACVHTNTHVHTHVRTRVYMSVHICVHVCTHMCTHMYTHVHTKHTRLQQTHAHTNIHKTLTHMGIPTHMFTSSHHHTPTHMNTPTYTPTHMDTSVHTNTRMYTPDTRLSVEQVMVAEDDDDDDDDDDDGGGSCRCIVALRILRKWHNVQNCSNLPIVTPTTSH